MSDLGGMADAAYSAYGEALRGSGAEATREFQQILNTRADLDARLSEVVEAAEKVHTTEFMPDIERQQRLESLRAMGESLIAVRESDLQKAWSNFKGVLETAAASDLVVGTDSDRVLVRGEIDRYLAEATKPAQEAWGGAPFRPGKTVKEALLALVQQNPQRYGPEVSSDYGRMLLGSQVDHTELSHMARLTTPGTTPKSMAARTALAGLATHKPQGHTVGITFSARQRLETALTPPRRTGFQPDTLRLRR